MRKDVSQYKQVIGFDPFRLAVVTAIDDAVAMFGHQQVNDTLVKVSVRLAESVLDCYIYILTRLPVSFTQALALDTIDKNQFFTLLQSTAFDVAMRCNTDVPLFISGHAPAHRKYCCEYQSDNKNFLCHNCDFNIYICNFCHSFSFHNGVPDVCGDKPFATAKLLQKTIYIQIPRFIFAYCKLLKYKRM